MDKVCNTNSTIELHTKKIKKKYIRKKFLLVYSYIIKYSGEITIKKPKTRNKMVQLLNSNIIAALKDNAIRLNRSKSFWGFLLFEVESPADGLLSNTSGIQNFSRVEIGQEFEVSKIVNKGIETFKNKVKDKKFAVKCKTKLNRRERSYRSRDIEIELGSELMQYSNGVNLSNPDITCFVEIRDEGVFYYSEKQKGLGGFPLGNAKQAIVMLSGGIDSPVAAYKAIKMGILPIFIYFDLGSKEQYKATLEVFKFLSNKYLRGQAPKMIVVPMVNTIQYIRGIQDRYQNLLLKYFFYKICENIGLENKAPVVISGEAISQVSTQTIENLLLLDQYIGISVFRPTLFMPKLEIIDVAKDIGSFDMAYKGKEYCAISNSKVATAAKKYDFDKIVKDIPIDKKLEEIKEYLYYVTMQNIDKKIEELNKTHKLEDEKIIIINLSSQKIKDNKNEVVEISLDDALEQFEKWDKSKSYKIICDMGLKSRILQNVMKKENFNIVPN